MKQKKSGNLSGSLLGLLLLLAGTAWVIYLLTNLKNFDSAPYSMFYLPFFLVVTGIIFILKGLGGKSYTHLLTKEDIGKHLRDYDPSLLPLNFKQSLIFAFALFGLVLAIFFFTRS